MDMHTDPTRQDDDLEPMELGSVSEETRGGFSKGVEYAVGPTSRLIPMG